MRRMLTDPTCLPCMPTLQGLGIRGRPRMGHVGTEKHVGTGSRVLGDGQAGT